VEKVTPAVRSRIMASIRSRSNRTTEWRLRMLLVSRGFSGWTVLPNGIRGRPDFVFPRRRLAVFVDGCFWHACPRCYIRPATNTPYWTAKADRNRARDRRNRRALRREGWSVLSLWEHDLRDKDFVVRRIAKALGR
jgi:DNA mismatch endonuclease, patch repair protein